MFHIHKWSKWAAVTLVGVVGKFKDVQFDAQERTCDKCGLVQRKAL